MNLTARLHALSVALEVAAKSPIPSVLTLRLASEEARSCANEAAGWEAKLAAVLEMVEALQDCCDLLTEAYNESVTGSRVWKKYPAVWNEARVALAKAKAKGEA